MTFRLFVFLIVAAMTTTAFAADKIIIAHRGASGYLPEHTLPAKALAHGMGAHYIEQDVVLSKDGVPMVLHDHYLDTVTDVATRFPARARANGRFYAIDFTLAEIKTLSAFERINLKTGKQVFAARFPSGRSTFKVPTVAEEIEMIQGLNKATGKNIGIYPEIKAPAFHRAEGQDISRIVLDVLAEYGYTSKDDLVYVQCFDWNETQRIRTELGYEGKLIQLIAENSWAESPDVDFDFLKTPEGLSAIAKVADGIGPWINQLVGDDGRLTAFSSDAKTAGLAMHPYTARADALPGWAMDHDAVLTKVLNEADADGIFTDFPDLGVRFLNKN